MEKRKIVGLILFSLVTGLLVGGLEVIFGKILIQVTEWRLSYFSYFILFLPIAGLIIEFIYRRYGGISDQGMGLIFDVGHGDQENIPLRLIPIVMFSTWITHLFGGSAGREGVAVQIGGTLSHRMSQGKLAKYLPTENMPKIALITGMAAGFSGLFQTPIAAVFFALEVLVAGRFEIKALLPASIASVTAFFISSYLGLEKFIFPINQSISLDFSLVVKFVALGLIFGIVGRLFSYTLSKGKKLAKDLLVNPYYRIFIGGIVIALLILLLHGGRYAGLGTNLIVEGLNGEGIHSYDFILKLVLTVLTLSVGFQGGEVTPLFSIGCSLGIVLAPMFGLPIELVGAAGYIAVFGSGTNTLLAPILIGGEVFGFQFIPVFFITMSVAYCCNGNHSIYNKQKMLGEK